MEQILFKDYAELQARKDEIDKQIAQKKHEIEKAMREEEADIVQSDFGTFSLVTRKGSWEFPDEIKTLEEELKEAKAIAKAKGFATASESQYLRFDPVSTQE